MSLRNRSQRCLNDKERCEDASDVWQTYKDYVKKKRDYKREWRRQKKEESGRGSLGMVRDRGGMPRKRSTIPAHSVRVPRSPQVVEKLLEEEQNFLELDGHTGMGMDQMALVMEEIPSPEHLMVSDNDQVVYETEDQVENEETETDEQEEELLEEITSPVQELECSEPVQYVGDPGQEISEEDLLFLTRWDAVSAKIASVPDVEKRSRYLLIIEGLVNEACRP